jgi:hypothetical protein
MFAVVKNRSVESSSITWPCRFFNTTLKCVCVCPCMWATQATIIQLCHKEQYCLPFLFLIVVAVHIYMLLLSFQSDSYMESAIYCLLNFVNVVFVLCLTFSLDCNKYISKWQYGVGHLLPSELCECCCVCLVFNFFKALDCNKYINLAPPVKYSLHILFLLPGMRKFSRAD